MVCGNAELRQRYTKSGYDICTCLSCDLTQLHPLPPFEIGADIYSDGYFSGADNAVGYEGYAEQEREYLQTFAEDVRRIGDFVPSGSILDIGCGFGYFVRQAAAAGYDAYGVDLSADAVRVAERHLSGKVFQGAFESVAELDGKRFDVIFASHLIEHIPDPRSFVANLAERLTADGVVVFVTPNIGSLLARASGARWVSFKIPEHVAYYNRTTINDLIESAGLETLAIDAAYQYYALSFLLKRIRELIHPVGFIIPKIENLGILRDRMVRVTSGSLRIIARRRVRSRA